MLSFRGTWNGWGLHEMDYTRPTNETIIIYRRTCKVFIQFNPLQLINSLLMRIVAGAVPGRRSKQTLSSSPDSRRDVLQGEYWQTTIKLTLEYEFKRFIIKLK